MRTFIVIFSALFFSLPRLEARMLFNEFEKEVHSPYRDSIVPNYDVTVDGSRLSCPPTYDQEITLTTVEVEQEPVREKKPSAPPKKDNKTKASGNKLVQVEVYPSATIRYPEEHYAMLKTHQEQETENLVSAESQSVPSKPSLLGGTKNIDGKKTQEWFIVVKASSLLQDLKSDKEKLQKLFKSVAANIHEEDNYYFLMLGPAGRDSIGIMMKILERNNYLDATTVVAR